MLSETLTPETRREAEAPSASARLPSRAGSDVLSEGRLLTSAPPPLASIAAQPVLFRESLSRVRAKYLDLYHLPVLEYPDGSRSFHDGRLYRCHGLNVLFLRGDFVEMALQHGRLLADEIPHGAVSQASKMISSSVTNALGRHGALGNWFTQKMQRFLTNRMLVHSIKAARRVLGEVTALEEAAALSDATGVPMTDLVQGLFNPDILLILAQLSNGAHPLDLESFREANACLTCCSSFAAWGSYTPDGAMVVGRNMDFPLNGTYDRFPTVIYFEPTVEPHRRYMSFGSAGLHNAGITSYNEDGLFMSSHTVPSQDVSSQGVSAFVTANQVIRRAGNLNDAVQLFQQFQPPSGWSYLIADTKAGAVGTLEMSHSSSALRPSAGETHVQTNHFYAPEMLCRNTLLNTSVVEDIEGRHMRLSQRLQEARGRLDATEAISMLGDQFDPIVGQERGLGNTVAVHTTLTSVVLDPARQRVFVAAGSGPVPHNDYVELPLAGTFDRRDFPSLPRRVVRNDAFRKAHPEKLAATRTFIDAKIAYESDCDPQRAYELLQNVVQQDSSNPAYYFQLGIFALKNQEYDAALDAFQEMFTRPYLPAQLRRLAHYYRGRTYAHLGKTADARRELDAVLDDPATDRKLRAAAERAAWRTRVFGQCALRRRSLSIMMQHSDMLTY